MFVVNLSKTASPKKTQNITLILEVVFQRLLLSPVMSGNTVNKSLALCFHLGSPLWRTAQLTSLVFALPFFKYREFIVNTCELRVFGKPLYSKRNTCCCSWGDSRNAKRPLWGCFSAWQDSQASAILKQAPAAQRAWPYFAKLSECLSQLQGKVVKKIHFRPKPSKDTWRRLCRHLACFFQGFHLVAVSFQVLGADDSSPNYPLKIVNNPTSHI